MPINHYSKLTLMLKFISLLLLLILGITGKAQEIVQGSFSSLSDAHAVSVRFDFESSTVDGLPLSDFIENESFEEGDSYKDAFAKDLREIVGDFIEEFNDTNCPMLLTVSDSPKILLTVSCSSISRKGNEVKCLYSFTNKDDDAVIASISMTSKDGRVGSFTNLMGDAFEKAGKDLGCYIKKMIKQELKKQRKK